MECFDSIDLMTGRASCAAYQRFPETVEKEDGAQLTHIHLEMADQTPIPVLSACLHCLLISFSLAVKQNFIVSG